jgi:hypothetical protein
MHADHNTVLAALELANRAPSVHNTQPWHWLVGEHSVHLMADRSRPTSENDLLLSCGAALHHLRVAFAALGWRTLVRHLPGDPDHLAALETRMHAPTAVDLALAAAIRRRRTDRRAYSPWDIPAEHLDLMVRRAGRAGGLLVPVTDGAARWLLAGDDLELAVWGGHAGGDGGRAVPGRHPTGRVGEDGGQLLVLATLRDDPVSVLCAGEAVSATLLTATDLGLAIVAEPLATADARASVRDHVLDGAAHPQVILRAGWPAAPAPPPPSPARQAAETIGYLPGTHTR